MCDSPAHDVRNCSEFVRENVAIGTVVHRLYTGTAIPRGPRIGEPSWTGGWFNRESIAGKDFATFIDTLPVYSRLSAAFSELVSVVHKASNHRLYIGRAGATSLHARQRFESHRESRDARWMRPVFRANTDHMRQRKWEEAAIRWVKMHDARGTLCCDNRIYDDKGPWPKTEQSVIYVVACR